MAVSSPYLDMVPDYAIRDGVMHITAGEFSMCMSLRTFERGLAKSRRVIAEYYAQQAEVVPIRVKAT